jgi:2-furoate---CoA ligase
MDTATALRMAAARHPARPAIVDQDGYSRSFAELVDEVDAVAAGLVADGVRPGDRVVLTVANSPEAAVAVLAVQTAGAVAVPTNFRARSAALATVLRVTGAAALVVDPNSAATADELPQSPGRVVTLDGASCARSGAQPLSALGASGARALPGIDADEPAIALLTSGSTGDPKLIALNHRQSLARVFGLFMNHGFRHDDGMRALGLMPIYHTVGLHSVLLLPLLTGGSYHPVRAFLPPEVLRIVEEQAITYVFGAPTMFARLLEVEGAATRLSSVRDAMYAGAPMEPALVRRVAAEITPNLTHIYGNTETYNSLYHRDAGQHPGALLPGVFHRVRIAPIGGDVNEELPPGAEGELLVDTASEEAFDGYAQPEQNVGRIDDVWYRTGDVAVRDDEGHIFIRGRTDDMIISGGENIYPADVANVVAEHPGIAECAVVGVPDPTWGELVAALVVRADPGLTEAELAEFCRSAPGLDRVTRPRVLLFADELPVNPSGKRPASELRALAARLTRRLETA